MTDDPPDEVRRILEERARALADAGKPAQAESETLGMVVLAAGGERCGVDLSLVQEIDLVGAVTPIPGVPEFWAGVVNLRGTVCPVLDLARHLGFGQARDDGEARVVLVAAAGTSVGLLVDEVSEIRSVPVDQIRPVVSEGSGDAGLFTGVTDDMVSLLDTERLLTSPAIVVEHELS